MSEKRARYTAGNPRGFKKHSEGYHRSEKRRSGRPKNHCPDFTQDGSLMSISLKDTGPDDTNRLEAQAAHKALNLLQKSLRKIYCRSCSIYNAGSCDGHDCSVIVQFISRRNVSRYSRPMPNPDKPLPVGLGLPAASGRRRILPRKVPGL